MRGAIPPLPQYAFMEWYTVKKREFLISADVPSKLRHSRRIPGQYFA
jgi:hypothetical protein